MQDSNEFAAAIIGLGSKPSILTRLRARIQRQTKPESLYWTPQSVSEYINYLSAPAESEPNRWKKLRAKTRFAVLCFIAAHHPKTCDGFDALMHGLLEGQEFGEEDVRALFPSKKHLLNSEVPRYGDPDFPVDA